jgi:hypothetical protein
LLVRTAGAAGGLAGIGHCCGWLLKVWGKVSYQLADSSDFYTHKSGALDKGFC